MSFEDNESAYSKNFKPHVNSRPADKTKGNISLGSNLTTSNSDNSTEANFEARVQFIGDICPPTSKFFSVPPCTGPYPDYELIIYSENGKTIVARTITDSNGTAKTRLSPGSYLIYTRAGMLPSDLKTNHFVVENGKVTRLSLSVDTGLE